MEASAAIAAAAVAAAKAEGEEIALDHLPLLCIYKSGRIHRPLDFPPVPAGLDPATGVTSKDVSLPTADGSNFLARLYLPAAADDAELLPVIVYFHGGGFIAQTAAAPAYYAYHTALSSVAKAIVVSVDYGRPPEHPLPAAYDDAWAAVVWTAEASDPWLEAHGDVSRRLFLAGDSAGGNIAHNVAMRAGAAEPPVRIRGAILLHPWFWGKEAVGKEPTEEEKRMTVDRLWEFACPGHVGGADDPRMNPLARGAPGLEALACERLMVCVAEEDLLCWRGKEYASAVRKVRAAKASAAAAEEEVELVETEKEGHVFFLFKPESEKAKEFMERVVAFIAK